MSFITLAQANSLLGTDFAPEEGDKARAVLLANTWMKNEVGCVPDPMPEDLTLAAAEIIKGIVAGEIYKGKKEKVLSKTVSAQAGTSVSKTYAENSRNVSSFEEIAIALIDASGARKTHFNLILERY